MRIEWAKSKARADCWREEIQLLCEEMRRVIQYFSWKAQWWTIQGSHCGDAQEFIHHGAAAYAAKQATMFDNMAKAFAADWYPYLISQSLSAQWPIQYIPTLQQPLSPMTDMTDMDVDS